uniref:SID1 transmembrane family member 1 n=1 Tax=Gopherus evgoodei TaxID=1825980 RepID=A0A8C4VNK9_9SAUR
MGRLHGGGGRVGSWLMCLSLSLPSLSAVFGLVYRPRDFASYMLGIFICNLLLYLAFYIIMKLRSSEKLLPIPLFCIVATAVVWAAALYFFFQNLSSWEVKTPAESREKNRPCILLGFFDDHDVWHFLSAAALFFSFLVSVSLTPSLAHSPSTSLSCSCSSSLSLFPHCSPSPSFFYFNLAGAHM